MQSKKLDKSLLPKPQYPLGWKKNELQISTSKANDLLESQQGIEQVATRKHSQTNPNSHPFSNKKIQSQQATPQQNSQWRLSSSHSNRKSQASRNINQQQSPSQYSLQQKQLLTFAGHQQSNQRIRKQSLQKQQMQKQSQIVINDSNIRRNNFSRVNNNQSYEDKVSNERNNNKSQSKNKEHKSKMYKHFVPQEEQFIAYSVVTKQSRSGMFLNQKLLVLNSSKRQLSYYSNLPKLLPFSSYSQIQNAYLNQNRPKEMIELDKVRRFMFIPTKGNLAGVVVSYVNESGERKQWRLGVGNNAVMNEWIETVNEVVKKQHLSIVRSQVKYPPKPKKQPQNKPNNYETKFTKTLKQQVLPLIRESFLSTTGKSNNNSLINSAVKSSRNNQPSSPTKSAQKQYLVESSKFVNTKNYVIDLEDARNEDIFYVPPPPPVKQERQNVIKSQNKISNKNQSNKNNKPSLLGNYDQQNGENNSLFLQQLEKKQRLINSEHQNRVNSFDKRQNYQKVSPWNSNQNEIKNSQYQTVPHQQPFGLNRKSSGERSSQSTHKDLNIHIESKISFQEYDVKQEKEEKQKVNSKITYEPNDNYKPHNNLPKKKLYTTELEIKNSTPQKKSINKNVIPSPIGKRKGAQIQDIIVGNNTNRNHSTSNNQGYILNFSPHSFNNNWFRLWIQTQPSNRVQIYTAFVKACRTILSKIIDSPQQFSHCYQLNQNNSHIIFCIENISFKLPFKLHLPQGLGEFITIMDFIRSEDFLTQVFKYKKELYDEFQNYQFVLNQLSPQFNNGILSMPIYFPMCCLIEYKGITVLCKPAMESSRLKIHKLPKEDIMNYESELEYMEEKCHVSLKLMNSQQTPQFDLYQIYLPSFNKSIIYMDNLSRYLPLLSNPLMKSENHNLQLNKTYIQQHINKGLIMEKKDLKEIQNHLLQHVIKNVVVEIGDSQKLFDASKDLLQKGVSPQHFGIFFKRLSEDKHSTRNPQKLSINISCLLADILLTEYKKACDLYMMKEFVRQLTQSVLTDSIQPLTKIANSHASKISSTSYYNREDSNSFGKRFQVTVLEMLHYLLCRNTKVWGVLISVASDKYGLSQFSKRHPNQNPKEQINNLLKFVNFQQLAIKFLEKINVSVEVKSWSVNQSWEKFAINQNNISVTSKPQVHCFQLDLFNPQYTMLINELSQENVPTHQQKDHSYSLIFQVLNLSEQTYQGQNYLIRSPQYELIEMSQKTKEKLLIDLCLTKYIPTEIQSGKYSGKEKMIDLYKNLLTQSSSRRSQNSHCLSFEININGIKWLIKQKQFSLVEVLIQQQLEAINIWYSDVLLIVECKLLDVAAMFYHNIMGNKNNLAIQYSLKSLKLTLQNKHLFKLQQLAQRSFQCANIHFQCQDIQKSLQLYELTQEIIYENEKNKKLTETDLSVDFLKISLRKAQIKLSTGKTTQTLYCCLECLRRCEQFQGTVLQNENDGNQSILVQKLAQIQVNVFEVIFRCYEVMKNFEDMRRISKVCCSKFIEDKLLKLSQNLKNVNNSKKEIDEKIMTKVLKICWIVVINELIQKGLLQNHTDQTKNSQQKPFIPLPQTVKSFCLSGALSQQNNTRIKHNRTYRILQDLKEKLLALCNLYPRNRYNNSILASFVCRQILQNSDRIKKTIKSTQPNGEYELIGMKNNRYVKQTSLSNRMQYLINNSIKQHEYGDSVLYELMLEVVGQLTGNKNRGQQDKHKENYKNQSARKSWIERFNHSSQFFTQNQRRSHSKQSRRQSFIGEQSPHARTSVKNPMERFYQSSSKSNEPSVLPFSLQADEFQPQLSISSKRINYNYNNSYGSDFKGQHENSLFSVTDQMDRKYMLIEAMFGLCGRQFVMGMLDDAIERQKLKYNQSKNSHFTQSNTKTTMFYD